MTRFFASLLAVASCGCPAMATPPHRPADFHGLLLTCGPGPIVQVSGRVAYAYEADLTHYVEGTARLGWDSVTLSFTGHGTFTISRRSGGYVSGRTRCVADDV